MPAIKRRSPRAAGLSLYASLLAGVVTAGPALVLEATREAACSDMRAAGVIPRSLATLILGHPDGIGEAFACLLPGQRLEDLHTGYVLPQEHEDEPRLVAVLVEGEG